MATTDIGLMSQVLINGADLTQVLNSASLNTPIDAVKRTCFRAPNRSHQYISALENDKITISGYLPTDYAIAQKLLESAVVGIRHVCVGVGGFDVGNLAFIVRALKANTQIGTTTDGIQTIQADYQGTAGSPAFYYGNTLWTPNGSNAIAQSESQTFIFTNTPELNMLGVRKNGGSTIFDFDHKSSAAANLKAALESLYGGTWSVSGSLSTTGSTPNRFYSGTLTATAGGTLANTDVAQAEIVGGEIQNLTASNPSGNYTLNSSSPFAAGDTVSSIQIKVRATSGLSAANLDGTSTAAVAGSASIATRAETLTAARGGSGGALCPNDGLIYMFGGGDSSDSGTTTITTYDPSTRARATKSATLPIASNRVSAVWSTSISKFIVVGLGTQTGGTKTNAIYWYDPVADTFTLKTETLTYTANNIAVAEVGGTDIYFMGGELSNGAGGQSVNKYVPSTNTVTSAASLPGTLAGGGAAAVVAGKIYLGGGFSTSGKSVPATSIVEYTPGSNTWATKTATIPAARFGMGVYTDGTTITYFGGHGYSGGVTDASAIYVYTPGTDSIATSGVSLPAARGFPVVALAQTGKVDIIGGMASAAGQTSIYEYTPPSAGTPAALNVNVRIPASSGNVSTYSATGTGATVTTPTQGAALEPTIVNATSIPGLTSGQAIYNTFNATANGAWFDNGASSSNGAEAMLQVLAALGASPSCTVKVQHSTDGVTGVDLLTFSAATAAGAQRQTIAAGTTINRYARVVISSITGTFCIAVVFSRF